MNLSNIFTAAFIIGLFSSCVRMATSILWAGLGEMFSERAGVMNIGLEGIMLTGAFSAYIGALKTGNPWLGVLSGVLAGILWGLIVAFTSVTLKVNQIVVGMAINIISLGATSYLNRVLYGLSFTPPQVKPLPVLAIPLLSEIPIIGPILFEQTLLVYLALLFVPISWFVLYKTTIGLKIRAVGEHPRAADTVGINVSGVRYASVLLCGAMTGLGGAFLCLGQLNLFADGLTSGRGFMALAAVIFGKWDPFGVLAATLLFGTADALQFRLQTLGLPVSYRIFLMLPYVLTIIALVGVVRRVRSPASLSTPYDRKET
jgi:simple sugar transport system permease protein